MNLFEMREWSEGHIPDVTLTKQDMRLARTLEDNNRMAIRPSESGVYLETASFVGCVRFQSFDVLVRPKFSDDRNFHKMIAYALDLEQMDTLAGHASARVVSGHFTDLLFHCLVTEIQKILNKGLLKRFHENSDFRSIIHGKIDFNRTVRTVSRGMVGLFCNYEDLTHNTLENRILLSTIFHSIPLIRSRALRHQAAYLREMLAEICVKEQDLGLLLRRLDRETDRLNGYYEPALRLCKLIYECLSFTFDGPFSSIYPAFLFDMNALFERFLGRLLTECAPPGYEILYQRSLESYRNRSRGDKSPMIPDYQVTKGGQPILVADAKYKMYGVKRVSAQDLYQLTVYGVAAGTYESTIYYPDTHSTTDSYDLVLPPPHRPVKVHLKGIPLDFWLKKLGQDLRFDEGTKAEAWEHFAGIP